MSFTHCLIFHKIVQVANIQLQFLLNTILFLSREGFRRSCLRASVDKQNDLYTFFFELYEH
jgi:hypothetical protein